MKIKSLLLAGSLAAMAAATAPAQTVIHISGAPAARQPGTTAIYNVLLSSTTGPITYAYSGSSSTTLTTANALTFYGGNVGGTPVTVKVSYVGSSAGIQDVAAGLSAKFLPDGATFANSPYAEPTTSSTSTGYESHVPDFTISDEFQASTPWLNTSALTGTSVNYAPLTSDIVGVLPYKFVSNKDAPARLANITPQQAQVLFEYGSIQLSQLTGTSSDEGTSIYAIGRDTGSGLRTVLLSETGIGVQTGINQYEPTISGSGSAAYVSSQVLYPPETVNGEPLPKGDGGYSSFTGLLAALSAYTNSNSGAIGGYYVTGLAASDATTAITAGAHELSYNGFSLGSPANGSPAGSASPALAEGEYTFWSYIQLQYLSSLSGLPYQFEQKLKTDLHDTDATVLLKYMNVYRTADGGNIYYFQGGYY